MTERKPKHMEIHAEVVRSGDAALCPVLRAGVGGRYLPCGCRARGCPCPLPWFLGMGWSHLKTEMWERVPRKENTCRGIHAAHQYCTDVTL